MRVLAGIENSEDDQNYPNHGSPRESAIVPLWIWVHFSHTLTHRAVPQTPDSGEDLSKFRFADKPGIDPVASTEISLE